MWILYAALGALAKALTSVVRKKISKRNNAIYVFLSFGLITIAVTLIVLIAPGESLGSIKYAPLALIISGLVQTVAIRANMYAFKHEELSYITPMFALTPLYAALVAYLTIGETPSGLGILGITAIVVGVYIVTSSKGIGIRKTLKHIARNKGARAGMLVPLSYAVAATFNKDAINQGVTPIASLILITAVMSIGHIYVLFNNRNELKETIRDKSLIRLIFIASLFGVASIGFASLALNGAFTSYALSIRRLDVLITVFIGWKFMGDSNFVRRITGASIMVVGVLLISLS